MLLQGILRSYGKRLGLLVASWAASTLLAKAEPFQPELVKDIGVTPAATVSLKPRLLVAFGDKALMAGDDSIHGEELWISDGTTAGTRLVKDIWPGRNGSSISQITVSNGKAFFVADDGSHGLELWVTDGTEAGTAMLVDEEPGSGNGAPVYMVAYGEGVLFITSSEGDAVSSLNYSNAAGTVVRRLATMPLLLRPNCLWSDGQSAWAVFPVEGDAVQSVWRIEGGADPVLNKLVSLPEGEEGSPIGMLGPDLLLQITVERYPRLWTAVWKCAAGSLVKLPVETDELSAIIRKSKMVVAGGKAFFLFFESSSAPLMVTDGTPGGTQAMNSVEWSDLTLAGQKVLVHNQNSVWSYDPQSAEWEAVFNLNTPARINSFLGSFGNKVVFSYFENDVLKYKISDGTALGTQDWLSWPSFQIAGSASPRQLRSLAGLLYFSADDGVHGRELWRSDGTPEGTFLLRDIHPGLEGGDPQRLVEMNGTVYFTAKDPDHGVELWRTDGTPEGTALVCDTRPGKLDGRFEERLTVFQGRLYFSLVNQYWDRYYFTELWTSDGTAEGTFVHPAFVRENLVPFLVLAEMDGWLYMAAWDTLNPNSGNVLVRMKGDLETLERCGLLSVSEATHVVVRPPMPEASVSPDKHVLFIASGDILRRCSNGENLKMCRDTGRYILGIRLHGTGVLLELGEKADEDNLFWSDGSTQQPVRWGPPGHVRLLHESGGKYYYSQDLYDDSLPFTRRALNCMNLDGSGETLLLPEEVKSYTHGVNVSILPIGDVHGGFYFARKVRDSFWTLGRSFGTPERTQMLTHLPFAPTDWLEIYDRMQPSGMSEMERMRSQVTVVQKLGSNLYFSGRGALGDELYALNTEGIFEMREWLGGGGSRVLEAGGTVTWPLTAVGQRQQKTLLIRNTGEVTLRHVTLSLSGGADFAVEASAMEELEPGASGEILVKFSPLAGGQQHSTLTITADGVEGAVTQRLELAGAGLAADELPVLRASPASGFVFTGQPLTLQADILSAAPFTSTVWTRDSEVVSNTLELSVPAAQLADAGCYKLTVATAAGELSSDPAWITLLTRAPGEMTVDEGKPAVLACHARAPAGCKLRYQWWRNGMPLRDAGVVKGSVTNTLKISRTGIYEAGEYDCVVTVLGPDGEVLATGAGPLSRSHGGTQVRVTECPRILETELVFLAGVAVEYQVRTQVPASVFTATGLPPGLKMSRTGLITGVPLRSHSANPITGVFEPFPTKLRAANSVGAGPVQSVPILVQPFIPAGGYDCLLGPVEGVSHGAQVKFVVSSSGGLSGQLVHRGKVVRFASSMLVADADSVPARMTVSLGRGDAAARLFLKAPEVDAEPWEVTLEEGALRLSGLCRRQIFHASRQTYIYSLPCSFTLSGGAAPNPEGTGYLTTSTTRSGMVTWRGRLPDGTAAVGSNALSCLRPGGLVELLVHTDLYKATGSVNGTVVFPSEANAVVQGLRSLSGSFSWAKQRTENSKERNYKEGFARHVLQLQGARIQPLRVGTHPLGLLGAMGGASLTGTDFDLQQTFSVTLQQKVLLPGVSFGEGTFLKSLSFAAKAGTFKGTVSVPHPTDPKLNRTASFEGAIVSGDGLVQGFAEGFCLLPDLPGDGETLKTSPLKSLRIRIVRK